MENKERASPPAHYSQAEYASIEDGELIHDNTHSPHNGSTSRHQEPLEVQMSVSRHPVRDADLLPNIPASTPKHAVSGNFLWHMDHASPAYSDFSARGRDRSPHPSGSFKTPDSRHRTAYIPGHTPHHYYGYGHHPYHSPYGHRGKCQVNCHAKNILSPHPFGMGGKLHFLVLSIFRPPFN